MRTTIRVDDDLLRQAADELGTDSSAETVRAALEQVVTTRRRRDAMAGLDLISDSLAEPDALDGAWR
ncbi:VapB protein of antitoxin of type II toxin-antitoxin system [Halopolyspora algeriensis]|uniref:VapB protein of antitoxin of type II toxin-antitoxin system n=1 Tax=Halopolyspora algeriensis TaxID=1500506 RepID=A0A368VPT0_9ACTN|nr:type II toxin-antitoxin system VapB family antitoxin [Halopolyspora algeriensis]RCW43540.1 VapB protein of antitoxin of type II toxin-antitoxin system [Halopolyspora algeriensis]TQM46409.1 VapB protein of antitoxin of type II toxin-antitoxin system [Halopolyspora algeriensis]